MMSRIRKRKTSIQLHPLVSAPRVAQHYRNFPLRFLSLRLNLLLCKLGSIDWKSVILAIELAAFIFILCSLGTSPFVGCIAT